LSAGVVMQSREQKTASMSRHTIYRNRLRNS
jgi:hypothetical protein